MAGAENVYCVIVDKQHKSHDNHSKVAQGYVSLSERYFLSRVFQGLSAEESADLLELESGDAQAFEKELLGQLRGVMT